MPALPLETQKAGMRLYGHTRRFFEKKNVEGR